MTDNRLRATANRSGQVNSDVSDVRDICFPLTMEEDSEQDLEL